MILALILTSCIGATMNDEPMPAWVIPGIAMIESESYQSANGGWVYVNRKRGAAGERGFLQVTEGACLDVERITGRSVSRASLERGTAYCARIAIVYLNYLHQHCASWEETVACYNAGLVGFRKNRRPGLAYLARVRAAGGAE